MSGRAPNPKGSLDFCHQRNVGFISSTLQRCPIHQKPISANQGRSKSKLTIRRSWNFAFFLPLRVVFGFANAALYPPATRSGSRRLSGFLNPDLLVEVVVVARVRREEKSDIVVFGLSKSIRGDVVLRVVWEAGLIGEERRSPNVCPVFIRRGWAQVRHESSEPRATLSGRCAQDVPVMLKRSTRIPRDTHTAPPHDGRRVETRIRIQGTMGAHINERIPQ